MSLVFCVAKVNNPIEVEEKAVLEERGCEPTISVKLFGWYDLERQWMCLGRASNHFSHVNSNL